MFWKYMKKHYASELDEQMYPGLPDEKREKKKKKFGISTQESMERIQKAAKRSNMRRKRSSAEFYDPFGESSSFNAVTKPIKSRRSSDLSLFSTGSASSWNDFFSGETEKKTVPPTQAPLPPTTLPQNSNIVVKKKKKQHDSETESFISRMKQIEEERRARRKREDAARWEREAEARRAAHHARSITPKKDVKPPSLSYSEHISNDSVTQHGNVISEVNLKAVQKVIQKLHLFLLSLKRIHQHHLSLFQLILI